MTCYKLFDVRISICTKLIRNYLYRQTNLWFTIYDVKYDSRYTRLYILKTILKTIRENDMYLLLWPAILLI